jgi:hypothetical protein
MALSKPMEMLAAATAAGVGGFMATGVLYPLDTLKTRMQSGAKALPDDADADGEAGSARSRQLAMLKSLYKGIQYKIAESTTSKFFYFYAYTLLAQVVAPRDGQPIGTATNLAIGYLSEFVHLPVTLPMEVIATKLQTGAKGAGGVLEIVRGVFQESGLAGFYKGFNAYFVLCLQPAIQYTVFERVKTAYLARFKKAAHSLGALEVRHESSQYGSTTQSLLIMCPCDYCCARRLCSARSRGRSRRCCCSRTSAPRCSSSPRRRARRSPPMSRVAGPPRPRSRMALSRRCSACTARRARWRSTADCGPSSPRCARIHPLHCVGQVAWRFLTALPTCCARQGALSSAVMLMIKEKIQMYITVLMIIANSSS